MQLRISPSMRSITISNGVVDSMKLRVGPVPPLLPHHPPHHHASAASSASSYRSLFYVVLVCACLLPFVFIRTALVTLEGLECSSLDCFKMHIGPSIFGKSNSNSKKLVKELYEVLHKVDKEEVPISENLPDTFHEFMSEMKSHKYDARTFAVRLKATMENMNKEIKKSKLSEQLFKHYAASAVPRGIHCLSLRLTDEYSSNAHARKQLPPPELLPILSDNSYHHLVLATDNILAASVVVSSAIQSSKNAERMVFHIITDKKTYPGMHSWFALNAISPAIIEVKSVHQFGWLTRENVPVLEALENHHFVRSHYHGTRASAIGGADNPRAFASKLQARSPMYISLLNHLRIFLPELFPNLDKVLFLDDDVVIQRDLSPLWEIDLQGKVMGAVETCRGDDKWVMSKRFRTYFNFSHPQIVANLDPDECPWAFGMNIFDLSAWRKTNIRETFHYWVKEMSKGIRWKDEEAQVDDDNAGTSGDEERGTDAFQIQFQLHDGSDIGPTMHSAETTIGNIKETILPQWPPGFPNAPKSVQDFKLIHGGQALENDKTLGEYFNPPSAFLGITTIHVVMKPPSGFKLFRMKLAAKKFGCVIL